MIHAALKETLECLKGEVPQTLRFAEEAKRTLAEALEAFLEVYYHRVHLLTHHRGCITPSSKDFALATLRRDLEALFGSHQGKDSVRTQHALQEATLATNASKRSLWL